MKGSLRTLRRAAVAVVVLAALYVAGVAVTGAPGPIDSALAQDQGRVPGEVLGGTSDSEFWRAVRRGDRFQTTLPDARAGILVQSEGDNWRAVRNGPVSFYGGWAMAAVIVLLGLFFLLRGRVRVEHGQSGRRIQRFNGLERFAHWLTASSFIVLALTGLNIMFGRYVLKPLLGPDIFSAITLAGKYAHNFVAFAFMTGLVLIFVLWVRHNIIDRYDIIWLIKGGGILVKGVHPPAKKFNFGQKVMFWIVVLGGLSLSLSGISLLFPFEFAFYSATNAFLNLFGFDLPTDLTSIQEMQLSQIWHAIVALFMIVVIIAHIYIGTLGMEDAFWAMGTGEVDENWAREHHSLWAAEVTGGAAPQPAAEGGDD